MEIVKAIGDIGFVVGLTAIAMATENRQPPSGDASPQAITT